MDAIQANVHAEIGDNHKVRIIGISMAGGVLFQETFEDAAIVTVEMLRKQLQNPGRFRFLQGTCF